MKKLKKEFESTHNPHWQELQEGTIPCELAGLY